eukprot:gene1330-biopygen4355
MTSAAAWAAGAPVCLLLIAALPAPAAAHSNLLVPRPRNAIDATTDPRFGDGAADPRRWRDRTAWPAGDIQITGIHWTPLSGAAFGTELGETNTM